MKKPLHQVYEKNELSYCSLCKRAYILPEEVEQIKKNGACYACAWRLGYKYKED